MTTDLDRLTRLTKAYEYQTLVGRLEKAERELQRKEEEAAARRAGCEAAGRELGELEGEVKRVKAAREKVSCILDGSAVRGVWKVALAEPRGVGFGRRHRGKLRQRTKEINMGKTDRA